MRFLQFRQSNQPTESNCKKGEALPFFSATDRLYDQLNLSLTRVVVRKTDL